MSHHRIFVPTLAVVLSLGTAACSGGGAKESAPSSTTSSTLDAPQPPTEVNVSNDPNNRFGEPQIAVNPLDQDNLVYAVMTVGTTYACQKEARPQCAGGPRGFFTTPGFMHISVYASFDGGVTWETSEAPATPSGHDELVQRGDAAIAAGPDGTFYLGWSAVKFGLAPETNYIAAGGIAVSTSTDGGRTWSDPVLTGTPFDRPFLTVDQSTGIIYAASSGAFGALSLGARDGADLPSVYGRYVVSSADGVTWSDPQPWGGTGSFADAANSVYAVAVTSGDAQLCEGAEHCSVFETTADAGETWSRHRIPLGDAGGGLFGPLLAADPTTPGHFAVGVANASNTEYLIYTTFDAGASWDGPTTVTENADRIHYHPWLAYSPKGVLGLIWRTNSEAAPAPGVPTVTLPGSELGQPSDATRESTLETLSESAREALVSQFGPTSPYTVWAAISRDGGATFTAPLKVSRAESPAPQANYPWQVGDDFSFVALSETHAFVAWADYRPGDRSAFFSAIDLRSFDQ